MVYYNERGYIKLINTVLDCGVDIPDRTGVGCRAIFDAKLIFTPDHFPFSTIRPMPLQFAFEEFWFFLRGETQTTELEKRGVNFWKGNTSREFLDNRGLEYLETGDMGEAYGWQFRRFGADSCDPDSVGVDQIVQSSNLLKNDPYSRRNFVTIWNPARSDRMALTPCWHSHQFVVLPDKNGIPVLHMKLINRSLDTIFGAMFAVQQYALYHRAMARLHGFRLGDLICDLTHVHIYQNQMEYTKELVTREFGVAGQVHITKQLSNIHDLISMEWSDIEVEGLFVNNTPFVAEKPPMAV